VEQSVGGKKAKAREFEVAVLGNDSPQASVVARLFPARNFYDYEDKYLSEGAVPVIPAVEQGRGKTCPGDGHRGFRACDLAGLARVDFLMEPEGKRRHLPERSEYHAGFTKISMYPKLWEATGLSYTDLITRLIELALERQCGEKRTIYSRE